MSIEERVKREKVSHTEDDVLKKSIELKNKFHHIYTYPSFLELRSRFDNSYLNANSLTVLDYGCGKGLDSLKLLKSGAKVFGIDISQKYINKSTDLALKNNFNKSQFNFKVMDAHNLEFPDNTFDLIIGNGILHHLDFNVALQSIHRTLKPGGRALFREPLANNPLLKLFRWLTPKARTIDENPFTNKDLKILFDKNKWDSENMLYCGLLSAPIAVITSILLPKYPNNIFLKLASILEKKINKYSFFRQFNQYVLLDIKKI